MAEFSPVYTIADFRSLDEGDVLEGYLDGVSCAAQPGSDRSRGYWHGWRNGQVDAGIIKADDAQSCLNAAMAQLSF